jgi:hypothetical protein
MPLDILLCDEVILYFILQVEIIQSLNLIWIQLSLQFLERFEN